MEALKNVVLLSPSAFGFKSIQLSLQTTSPISVAATKHGSKPFRGNKGTHVEHVQTVYIFSGPK